MDIGVDSFAAILPDPATGRPAAAARTTRIRLTSAVTVLSAADPVRVFQEFATLDLISKGRAQLVVGRGSFGEAFPLFGLDTRAYDDLFSEKLDLFLRLREQTNITWKGRFRPLVDLYRKAGERAVHDPAKLKMGVHAIGFIGETGQAAKEALLPGCKHLMSTVGRERGWSPPTREQFDDMAGEEGAFLIGDPTMVAAKMLRADVALGGLSRITFQMSTASLDTAAMRRSIELLGAEVAPIVRTARPATRSSAATAASQLLNDRNKG